MTVILKWLRQRPESSLEKLMCSMFAGHRFQRRPNSGITWGATNLSRRMNDLDGVKKSTPPQNRQLIVYYYELEQQGADVVGELTF